jgi:hypothetical protein
LELEEASQDKGGCQDFYPILRGGWE